MKIFSEIIELYNQINDIYSELLKLELNGRGKDVIFLELVSILKDKLRKEEELFVSFISDCKNDYNKIYRIINNKSNSFNKDIRSRILNFMNLYESFNVISDSLLGLDVMIRLDKLYTSCCRNIYLVYYSFLQEFIECEDYSNIKEYLLMIKYFDSFRNHDMESQLVLNDFDVSKINYVVLNMVADTLKLDMSDEVILDCYADTILTSLADLLFIKDIDYTDDNKIALSIKKQCMIRAGMALIGNNDYNKLIVEINNIINRLSNRNNQISCNIVNDIFSRRIKDRERIRKLSLRPLID